MRTGIVNDRRAPLDRHPRGRRHGARRRARGAARPPPAQAPAAGRDRRRGDARRSRCASLVPRSRARDVGVVRAADVGLPRDLRDAQRRPGGARARGCASTTRCASTARSGCGTTPTLRLQRALAHARRFARWEKVLVWSHWLWFAFPHGTVAYLLLRHREHFPRGAAQIYATFDLGVIGYWAVPTAPPWYAAAQGLMDDGRTPELRRMMVEYGEQFWKRGWAPLYGVLGGNPLAAMPSLHFATSVTAAHVLTDTGRVAGRARLDLRRDARPRARLPRRALRRRPRSPASRSPRAIRRGDARGRARRSRALSRARAALEAKARRAHERRRAGAARRRRTQPPPERRARRRRRARPRAHAPQRPDARAASSPRSIVALYFLLPQLAGLEDTWHRIEDGTPVLDRRSRSCSTFGMFGGYVAMFRGVFVARGERGSAGARATRSRWPALAASRIFAAGGAGGLVLHAWALRQAGHGAARGRRQDDLVPRPHLLRRTRRRVIVCGFGLRLGIFPGDGAVHDDRGPGGRRRSIADGAQRA